MTCFGGFPGKCNRVAGTPWTVYWCRECDEKRRARITENLKQMQLKFEPKKAAQ